MGRENLLVYGAYGFTGRLLVENLKARGIAFVAAGRDERRVARVASEFDAPYRVFDLEKTRDLDRSLSGVDVLLNAAGPFLATAAPLLAACLRKGVHYLDVSGEVGPLEHAASLDAEARKRKVMILPGIGFDVVPSDCLAVHLAGRLPGGRSLTLSVSGSNLLSRGSAYTFAEHAGIPVYVRKCGVLEPMMFRTQVRWVDFGFAVRPAIAVTWGDLVTAFRSTGIQDIEVYFEATTPRLLGVAGNQYFGWIFKQAWAKSWLRAYASSVPDGPSSAVRNREGVVMVGEVSGDGRRVRSRLTTPEAYTFTGIAAAAIVERVLGGDLRYGFQTPATLLGPDFVLSLEGVHREDLP